MESPVSCARSGASHGTFDPPKCSKPVLRAGSRAASSSRRSTRTAPGISGASTGRRRAGTNCARRSERRSDALRSRWSYVKGSSRRRLPALVTELREIDLFVHDSKHSERNLLYELEQARVAVRPGGI